MRSGELRAESAVPGNLLRVLGIAFAAWTLVGLLSVSQWWLQAQADGPPIEWRRLARLFEDMWVWAAYTPAILWLADRLPLEGGTWRRRLPLHVGIAFGFAGLDAVIATALAPLIGPFPQPTLASAFARLATVSVLSYFAVLAIGHALRYGRLHARGRLRAAELERQLAETRLGVLEAQLRPHFLFNALHTVASLVRAGEQQAAIRTIAGLGEILRAAIRDTGAQEIPLREELRLAERYLEIERARFEDRLAVRFEVDPGLEGALVPRFVLQPLVENAVRHGIEPHALGGSVWVRAARDGSTLRLEVADRGAGPAAPDTAGSGVGLANTRARLRHLYGEAGRVDVAASPDGGTCARVEVPYRTAAELAS